ncbi:hypothetical protein TWF788_003937 [Orbilia oligospora]|uniref:Nephrocystin 3-like N-terminal domain-containing protein n=1 Tax=Orbilia oligospora TaxID=2813651 RepID=A0A7C8TYC6_ORBOL|nr:hypothetical protein TWF788_003937 [Orbilia oligospora]
MLHNFPNIRIGFIISVSSRTPSSKHDIRLGDIVVSALYGGNSNIFQYDFGKTIQDQNFQTTGVLNQPPPILKTVLAGLGARDRFEGHELEAIISDILSKKKQLQEEFQRPNPSTDRLYKSKIVHSWMNKDCVTICGDKPFKLVSQLEQTEDDDNPAVHQGLIASTIPAKVQTEEKIADIPGILPPIENNVYEMQADVKLIQNKMRNTDIDRWLAAPNVSTNYNKALQQRHEGSGDWLIESKQFIEWKTSAMRNSFLWLHGIPGCGKTILSYTIIQALGGYSGKAEAEPACQPLIYFYSDFIDVGKQTLENMLRSLILLLSHKHEGALAHLEFLYSSCSDGRQPTIRSLCDTFLLMIEEEEEVWIVLDALDECRTRAGPATRLLTWMSEVLISQKAIVHFLATSRPETDIQSQIMSFARPQDVIPIQNSLISNDIEAYIFSRVRGGRGLKRWRSLPEVQNEVETCLMEKANGMFRWVACQLDAIENCLEYRSLRKSLISLPKTLDDTYAKILRNIPEEHKEKEAIDAIVVDTDDDEYFNPKYRMPDSDEILRYCSTLVVATELQLAHFSVKEYLTSDRLDSDIAQISKTPSPKKLLHHLNDTNDVTPIYYASFGGLLFAIKDLISKGHDIDGNSQYYGNTLQATAARGHKETVEFLLSQGADVIAQDASHYRNTLNAASVKGHLNIIKLLLKQGTYVSTQYKNCNCTLHATALEDHVKIVKLLLNYSADPNIKDSGEFGSILAVTSLEGNEDIIRILLRYSANINAQDKGFGNALQAAIARNRIHIVQLLLSKGYSHYSIIYEHGARLHFFVIIDINIAVYR